MALQKIDVDYDVAMEVLGHEAIIRQAYKDSVGKWTWSVGLTSATGHNVERYIDNPQPLQYCLDVYVWALRNYAKSVLEAFEGYQLTRTQFAAALSFHWNTGAIKKASWVQKVKAGDMVGAKAAFMLYDKPASIVARRTQERDLFFDGKWSNDGTAIEYTKLTANHTPVWSSAKRINVEVEMHKAIGIGDLPTDSEPEPDAPVEVPTVTPDDSLVNEPEEGYIASLWTKLKAWFTSLFS